MHLSNRNKALAALLAAAVLAGCSARNPDYQNEGDGPSLEVPPGLELPRGSSNMSLPELPARSAAITASELLIQPEEVRVRRNGQQRWLVISAEPALVWERVGAFFAKNGFELEKQQPAIGIMETVWTENRDAIPESFIREMVTKAFPKAFSSPYLDKFRVRLEQVDGATELYLSHYGVEQVERGEDDVLTWQSRPADPELTNTMLLRMLLHFGVSEQQASEAMATAEQAPERARLENGGLRLDDAFPRAWRRVGIALDRSGLVVLDRNRAERTYFVRPVEPVQEVSGGGQGLFGNLFGTEDDAAEQTFRVVLNPEGDSTLVQIQDRAGKPASNAQALLERLRDQLR